MPELTLHVSGLVLCWLRKSTWFRLSLEMGALIVGISISTFRYNLDVAARIITLRDFIITIFFVSLGMKNT